MAAGSVVRLLLPVALCRGDLVLALPSGPLLRLSDYSGEARGLQFDRPAAHGPRGTSCHSSSPKPPASAGSRILSPAYLPHPHFNPRHEAQVRPIDHQKSQSALQPGCALPAHASVSAPRPWRRARLLASLT